MERCKKVVITFDGEEYRVPGPDGREATASYTNDKQDALGTAAEMYAAHERPVTFRIKKVESHPSC